VSCFIRVVRSIAHDLMRVPSRMGPTRKQYIIEILTGSYAYLNSIRFITLRYCPDRGNDDIVLEMATIFCVQAHDTRMLNFPQDFPRPHSYHLNLSPLRYFEFLSTNPAATAPTLNTPIVAMSLSLTSVSSRTLPSSITGFFFTTSTPLPSTS